MTGKEKDEKNVFETCTTPLATPPSLGLTPQSDVVADEEWGDDGVLEWDGQPEVANLASAVSSPSTPSGENSGVLEWNGEPVNQPSSVSSSDNDIGTPKKRSRPKKASPTPEVSSPDLVASKPLRKSRSRSLSLSSVSEPLSKSIATTKAKTKAKADSKSTTKAKTKAKANDYIPLKDPSIDTIFTRMITADEAFHMRVLRYEVRHFSFSPFCTTLTCFSAQSLQPRNLARITPVVLLESMSPSPSILIYSYRKLSLKISTQEDSLLG